MSKDETSLPRREFLGHLCVAGAVSVAGVPAIAGEALGGVQSHSLEDFQPLVGETFRIRSAAGTVEAPLAGVEPLTTEGRPAELSRSQGFALVFDAPVVPQDVYEVSHSRLGTVPMLLTPVSQVEGDRLELEAVFN